jgi:mono/diheme cytochrome c family protein
MRFEFVERRALLLGVVMVAASIAPAAAQTNAALDGDSSSPTFYTDVYPILQANCQACHQPAGLNMGGMVAPMAFTSYEETRQWAPMIASAVKERRMPPWHASEEMRGRFHDERYLDDPEIEMLVAWAEAGAPAGARPADWAPPAASASENGWALGEPDLVVRFDEPFMLGDDVHDLYVNLPATLTEEMLPEDRWIKSIEYRPGPNVHHVIQRDWGGLVPGASPTIYENGYGRLLRAGPRVTTFNMHYFKVPGPGTATWDHTEVGIRFMEEGEVIRYVTGGNDLMIRNFEIPPGDPNYSATIDYVFDRDVYLISFMPHMHLRGKEALYELIHPDGREERLLHVDNYAFNWQHTYTFREPVLAKEGSKVRFTVTWDNSADNPHNPDPTVAVRWGLPTYSEMAQGYMRWREVEERHIVVGEAITDEVLDATGNEGDDPHDAHTDH